jgi:putative MATE family efflux protein
VRHLHRGAALNDVASRPAPALAAAGAGSLLRTTWTLAWPAIVAYAVESVVSLCDLLMVGRLGPTAVAAVGVGVQLFSAINTVLFAIGTGTLALVARHVGAGERRHAEEVLQQSILAAGLLAATVVIPFLVFTHAFIALFRVDAAVVDESVAFVRRLLLAAPGAAVVFTTVSSMRGAGDMRTPLLVSATVGVLNVMLGFTLIFGHFGFPALGVVGAGTATACAFTLGACLGVALLLRGTRHIALPRHAPRPRLAVIRRVLRIGVPAAGESLLIQLGFFVYIGFAATYGTAAVAAYFIGARILGLSFLPGLGFAAAAATLVGQHLGARRPDEAARSARMTVQMCLAMMSGAGALLYVGARQVAAVFVSDPAVIAETVVWIRVLACCQPLMAIDFALGGVLRGAGDTRFSLLSALVGFWGGRLTAAWLVTHVLHLGVLWLWMVVGLDWIGRGGLKLWRFQHGGWAHVRV